MPGFGPHDEVLVDAVLEPELGLPEPVELELLAPVPALGEPLELLLPQPAATSARTATNAAAIARRRDRAS
jgi:hypothetical protein